MKKDLQEIELTIKDVEDGIFAVSLVNSPAIEVGFVHLSSEEISLKVIDEEKRIVVGYALIPDKRIYRRVEDKEFNIFFTADTVKLASEMYMKQLNLNNVTVEHEKKVSDIGIIESWITEDKKYDKINLYGVDPIVGGWAIMMKVNNDEEWSKVKDGQYTGFSIEGKFAGLENLMSKNNNMDLVEEIKAIINAELKSEKVELGVMDDLKSGSSSLQNSIAFINKSIQNFDNAYKAMQSEANNAKKIIANTAKTVNTVEAKAKELGINPNSIPGFDELNKLWVKANQAIDEVNKF